MIGSMSALITPFKNGKVDTETYISLIERQARLGMDACAPVGTTGESATLSHNEHKECIEIAVSVAKKHNLKVLAGAGSNSTDEAIELAKFAQNAGADEILVVAPYYNKPTQNGLYEHFKAIAKSVDIPICLYNVPGRSGVEISVETTLKLNKEFKNITSIKEASGDLGRIVALDSASQNLEILSGDDLLNYPILASGGVGIVSVTGNLLPDKIHKLTNLCKEQNYLEARLINNELYAINTALFYESNPIPIKAAMFISGLIKSLEYRLPLVAPSKENMRLIEKVVEKYEVKK